MEWISVKDRVPDQGRLARLPVGPFFRATISLVIVPDLFASSLSNPPMLQACPRSVQMGLLQIGGSTLQAKQACYPPKAPSAESTP